MATVAVMVWGVRWVTTTINRRRSSQPYFLVPTTKVTVICFKTRQTAEPAGVDGTFGPWAPVYNSTNGHNV
eukprot:scaffold558_cov160-Skeletonema_menzelii.AAC.6